MYAYAHANVFASVLGVYVCESYVNDFMQSDFNLLKPIFFFRCVSSHPVSNTQFHLAVVKASNSDHLLRFCALACMCRDL